MNLRHSVKTYLKAFAAFVVIAAALDVASVICPANYTLKLSYAHPNSVAKHRQKSNTSQLDREMEEEGATLDTPPTRIREPGNAGPPLNTGLFYIAYKIFLHRAWFSF